MTPLRGSTLAAVAGLAVACLAAACNAIWGIELPNPDGGADASFDARRDAIAADVTAPDRSSSDAMADAETGADADAGATLDAADTGTPSCLEASVEDVRFAGACAPTVSPKMVKMPDVLVDGSGPPFCVDSTEVTSAEYAAFLASGPILTLPCECAFKDGGLTEAGSGVPGGLPVTGVDWCDAWAYCKAAGKRLCGAVGGGPVPWAMGGTREDELNVACGGPFLEPYPYGSGFGNGNCNVAGYAANVLTAGSLINCKATGGSAAAFDLLGNAAEWVDSCSNVGGKDVCRLAGGAYDTPTDAAAATCDYRSFAQRSARGNNIGFRCCWP